METNFTIPISMQTPPFISATEGADDCQPACLAMALSGLGIPTTLEEAKRFAGFRSGELTWPFVSYLAAAEAGLRVRVIDSMDLSAFIRDGTEYLARTYGETVAKQIDRTSDVARAMQDAGRVVESDMIACEQRVPEIADLARCLSEGMLAICHVNHRLLNDRAGYVGHAVLAYRIGEDTVLVHDPGLPPHEAWRMPRSLFVSAWGSPSIEARSIFAIGK